MTLKELFDSVPILGTIELMENDVDKGVTPTYRGSNIDVPYLYIGRQIEFIRGVKEEGTEKIIIRIYIEDLEAEPK